MLLDNDLDKDRISKEITIRINRLPGAAVTAGFFRSHEKNLDLDFRTAAGWEKSLVLLGAEDIGNYSVEITNDCGATESVAAFLDVNLDPVITTALWLPARSTSPCRSSSSSGEAEQMHHRPVSM